jgi:hypothetical protein
MELVTLVQTALLVYLPNSQHKILLDLMRGVVDVYRGHRDQLFAKFTEIIKAVAEKACADVEVRKKTWLKLDDRLDRGCEITQSIHGRTH